MLWYQQNGRSPHNLFSGTRTPLPVPITPRTPLLTRDVRSKCFISFHLPHSRRADDKERTDLMWRGAVAALVMGDGDVKEWGMRPQEWGGS